MKLLIDIGNSRIKLASYDEGAMQFISAIDTQSLPACQAALTQALEATIDKVAVCLVVSVGNSVINDLVSSVIGARPIRWIWPTVMAGNVKNGYPAPAQLGADRWVAMIGLTHHCPSPHPPLVLANFGTATTIDTLSADNEFKGGLILPGITMMRNALAQGTAQLPNTVGMLDDFPTNTASAITSGIAAAQVGALVRQIGLVRTTLGAEPKVFISGGARSTVAKEIERTLARVGAVHELPHVVLDGLGVLANTPEIEPH
jgi:type III pantothenate kinase